MNNFNNSIESGLTDNSYLNTLSGELNDILASYESTAKMEADLSAKITAFEARQQYLEASLAEGQRIASELLRNAQLRVENIMAVSNKNVKPQQDLIARIENEITELTRILESKPAPGREQAPVINETAAADITFPTEELPEIFSAAGTRPEELETAAVNFEASPDNLAEIPPAAEPTHVEITAAASDTTFPAEELPGILPAAGTGLEELETAAADFTFPAEELLEILPSEVIPAVSPTHKSESVIRMQIPEIIFEAGKLKTDVTQHFSMESGKSTLRLDAPFSYKCYADSSGYMHSHSWEVRIKVAAPEDKQEALNDGQALQVIQSTLLRYDGTIINDVYPFDIIPPTMTNVCMYLFNCLEDNLAFTDLDLTEVTIWLNQALLMRAKDRNRKFDELLQGRDESWRDLRGKFDNQ